MTTFEFGGKQYLISRTPSFTCLNDEFHPLIYIITRFPYNEDTFEKFISENTEYVNRINKSDTTPLMLACNIKNLSLIKLLIKYGADVNASSLETNSVLLTLCEYENCPDENIIKVLIEAGARVNVYNKNGVTPLYFMCTKIYPSNTTENIIKLLLEAGAYVNIYVHGYNDNPLMRICQNQNLVLSPNTISIIELLIKAGIDVNFRNYQGQTILWYLCDYDSLKNEEIIKEIIKILIDSKIDLNITDKYGMTILMRFCTFCDFRHNNIIKLLIENGANTNICNEYGMTSLIHILTKPISREMRELVLILLNSNINLNMKLKGQTQFEYICKMDEEIVKYCFDKHTYYTLETILKCISLGTHVQLLKPYAYKLLYQKIGYSIETVN